MDVEISLLSVAFPQTLVITDLRGEEAKDGHQTMYWRDRQDYYSHQENLWESAAVTAIMKWLVTTQLNQQQH